MTTFKEEFPSLWPEIDHHHMEDSYDLTCTWDEIKKHCLDINKVKEAIHKAVLGVNFKGYDHNSEKALCEMQKYLYKELKL